MSAQRRTTVKEKAPPPAPANPSSQPARPKDRAVAERGKAVAETRRSIVSVRTQAIRQVARDSYSEIKKVNWPDQQTTRNLTIVVIGVSTFLGLTLGGIDFLLEKLFNLMT
jgi:preprotein translocase SecE subunit